MTPRTMPKTPRLYRLRCEECGLAVTVTEDELCSTYCPANPQTRIDSDTAEPASLCYELRAIGRRPLVLDTYADLARVERFLLGLGVEPLCYYLDADGRAYRVDTATGCDEHGGLHDHDPCPVCHLTGYHAPACTEHEAHAEGGAR